jgi:hypothetical protein
MTTPITFNTSIDALGKNNDIFSFTVTVPPEASEAVKNATRVAMNDIALTKRDFDGEYLTAECTRAELVDTALADVVVGSVVAVVV